MSADSRTSIEPVSKSTPVKQTESSPRLRSGQKSGSGPVIKPDNDSDVEIIDVESEAAVPSMDLVKQQQQDQQQQHEEHQFKQHSSEKGNNSSSSNKLGVMSKLMNLTAASRKKPETILPDRNGCIVYIL